MLTRSVIVAVPMVLAAVAALAAPAWPAPQDPAADLAAGIEAAGEGRLEAAEAKFKAAHEALGGGPGDKPDLFAEVCYRLALTQSKIGIKGSDHADWDQDRLWGAEELLSIAVEQPKYASHADAWADLGWLRQQMRPLSASYFDLLTEKSVEACDKALALDPKHRRAGLIKGQCLGDRRSKHFNPEAAAQALEADLALFPGRLETVLALCEVYDAMGDVAGIERTARAGLGESPGSGKLRLWLGKAFLRQGNAATAGDQFKQAASAEPQSFEAVQLWVEALVAARTTPDKVLEILDAHAKAHPESAVPGEVRAGIQNQIGRVDDALATLTDLMRRFPKAKKAKHWAIMRVIALAGRRESEAQEDAFVDAVAAVLALDPKSDEAWDWFWPQTADRPEPLLVKTRRLGQWARGVAIADEMAAAITADADTESWAVRKAMCHWVAWECQMNLGANEVSEQAIRKAISLDPRNAHYHNSLGLLLRYLGRTDEAITAFQAALDRQINLPWAWENLGATYLAAGKVKEAREALTQGLAWAREDEQQYEAGQPELSAAQFETWKLRRLLIDAWRLESASK